MSRLAPEKTVGFTEHSQHFYLFLLFSEKALIYLCMKLTSFYATMFWNRLMPRYIMLQQLMLLPWFRGHQIHFDSSPRKNVFVYKRYIQFRKLLIRFVSIDKCIHIQVTLSTGWPSETIRRCPRSAHWPQPTVRSPRSWWWWRGTGPGCETPAGCWATKHHNHRGLASLTSFRVSI